MKTTRRADHPGACSPWPYCSRCCAASRRSSGARAPGGTSPAMARTRSSSLTGNEPDEAVHADRPAGAAGLRRLRRIINSSRHITPPQPVKGVNLATLLAASRRHDGPAVVRHHRHRRLRHDVHATSRSNGDVAGVRRDDARPGRPGGAVSAVLHLRAERVAAHRTSTGRRCAWPSARPRTSTRSSTATWR